LLRQIANITIILALTMVLALTPVLAVGVPAGADTTVGASETGVSTTSTQENISAGNLTFVDVNSDYVTNKWTGFYGTISGSFLLGDSSGNNFFEWTVADMTDAVVYASNTTINWGSGNFFPLAASFASPWLIGSGTDNFTNTFNGTADVDSGIFSLSNAPTATTNGGTGWFTYALYDGTNMVWAGNVRPAGDTAYDASTSVQYQMIVPEDGTGGDTNPTSYDLWVELQ
jgi:hypothetical protein